MPFRVMVINPHCSEIIMNGFYCAGKLCVVAPFFILFLLPLSVCSFNFLFKLFVKRISMMFQHVKIKFEKFHLIQTYENANSKHNITTAQYHDFQPNNNIIKCLEYILYSVCFCLYLFCFYFVSMFLFSFGVYNAMFLLGETSWTK